MILTLTPPLTLVKGGIKDLDVFAMHLIPDKGEVKHLNNFDSVLTRVKGVQRHHRFAYL